MDFRTLVRASTLGLAALPCLSFASSHREAPSIGGMPRSDGTDLYMFRSYEPGRADFVTFIANYIPFQDPQGGPNFYFLDDQSTYRINIDNVGDAKQHLSFQFSFKHAYKNLAVNAGGKQVKIPLINDGPVTTDGNTVNALETYEINLIRNNQTSAPLALVNETEGGTRFFRPVDNIGNKSIPNYATYAGKFIYSVGIPGCPIPGRVFVGQRKESFFIAVGEIFDLVNLNPIQARDAKRNDLTGKNITSIAIEVPIKCLVSGSEPVIGAFTSVDSYVPRPPDNVVVDHRQVSRLGMPLVNEVVIGMLDKDNFNFSQPFSDGQFLTYVTNPSLPILLNSLFGDAAKVPGMPRNDLVAVFLTGVKNLNQPAHVTPSEMLRLNTSIAPTPPASQNDLGVLGGDLAGFPNGRRPYDDVVDVSLRVVEGALCGAVGSCGSETSDPNGGTPYSDGVRAAGVDAATSHVTGKTSAADTFLGVFPYLNTPLAGAPQSATP